MLQQNTSGNIQVHKESTFKSITQVANTVSKPVLIIGFV